MSEWGMPEMAKALPEVAQPVGQTVDPTDSQPAKLNPQEHGWAAKSGYNYEVYNKSGREQMVAAAELPVGVEAGHIDANVMGVESGVWASTAPVYDFDPEEMGDIGPKHPALEEMLFGGENATKSGINFSRIAELEVTQEGTIQLQPVRKYEDAGLHPAMLENVKLAGYTVPTPIQQYCLPAVKLGHDIVACAQTGSGKTAAFLVPVLSKLMGKAKKLAAPRPNPITYVKGVTPPVRAEPLVLIVAPTRELATQIFNEARKFCYRTMLRPAVVYGGGHIADQISQLEKGCDVLVGTPGRLIDFINRPHILTLRRLKYMIIDEADEMLHSDWESELKQIMGGGDQEEGNIKYMMFSATFPKAMRDLAKEHLAHDHVRIRVGRAGSSHQNIKQDIVWVEPHVKRKCLSDLLLATPPARTIIFVNSKRSADELDDFLYNSGFPCVSIHADRTQREREDCIRAFRNGKSPILIATGVSARGLDINNVMHVINYDMPSTQYGGIEEYTHRIGRTGRIGHMGLATSFFNDRDADLGETLTKTLLETRQIVPDFLEQHIPEGFTADGQTGDLAALRFDADSDDGQGDENVESGEGGGWGAGEPAAAGGWGAPAADDVPAVSSGWGAPATAPSIAVAAPSTAPVASGWGAPAAAPSIAVAAPSAAPVASSWGAPAADLGPSIAVAAPIAAPVASGWGAPAPQVAQVGPPAAQGWGTPTSQAVPVPQAAAAGWGAPAPAAIPQAAPVASGWGAPQPTTGGWNTSGGW